MSDDSPLVHTLSRRAVRYKRVLISCFLLQQLVTQDSRSDDFPWGARCVEGVPPDARLVHSSVEWQGSSPLLALVFEHPEWPEVPEGHEIPSLSPIFARYRRGSQEQQPSTAGHAGEAHSHLGEAARLHAEQEQQGAGSHTSDPAAQDGGSTEQVAGRSDADVPPS